MLKITSNNLVRELDHHQTLMLLDSLGEDAEVRKKIVEYATVLLKQIKTEDELAEEVFLQLNTMSVIDLWESSGEGYYGYADPVEVAFDMLDNEVQPFRDKMLAYRRLNLKEQEMTYFNAIVNGLLKYVAEGTNEFRNWSVDDPYTLIENEIFAWHETYPETTIEQLEKLFGIHRTSMTLEEFREKYTESE